MGTEHPHLPPGVEIIATRPAASAGIPADAEARTVRITLQPGDSGAPPHRHPGPISGSVTQGDALFEPGGDVIHYQGANSLPDGPDDHRLPGSLSAVSDLAAVMQRLAGTVKLCASR